jgi:hypothetical protein
MRVSSVIVLDLIVGDNALFDARKRIAGPETRLSLPIVDALIMRDLYE